MNQSFDSCCDFGKLEMRILALAFKAIPFYNFFELYYAFDWSL